MFTSLWIEVQGVDSMELEGIHHLTAISAQIRENKRFYTETLGMRLVKRSVNQDDVSAYHLFYADAIGSPGSDLTFFDWPVPRERRGTPSIVRTHLRVAGSAAFDYWTERLRSANCIMGDVVEQDGRLTLDFEDPEGQRLSLVDDQGAGRIVSLGSEPGSGGASNPRARSDSHQRAHARSNACRPGKGAEHAAGAELFTGGQSGSVSLRVRNGEGWSGGGTAGPRATRSSSPPSRAPGGVHHVAFRVPDSEYDAWADRLNQLGLPNSGKVDRFWFHSLYFREPNGILFEIATDGPGFAVDEDEATLGEKVVLAPFLEPRRDQIIANLKPLD